MNHQKIIRDGHIHSPYCPHTLQNIPELFWQEENRISFFTPYVEKALEAGLEEISFTEHMPFSFDFLENKEDQDLCAPQISLMPYYFSDIREMQKRYSGRIRINAGFETDYLEGYEDRTAAVLDLYGSEIQDSLLSVHFVRIGSRIYDVDLQDGFEDALEVLGSVEAVYDCYYETLLKAVNADLGKYKPGRIGHPNIIRIFQKLYPVEYKNKNLLEKLAVRIKEKNYEVDADTAGLRKPLCGEVYLSGYLKELAEKYGIGIVYGSDAHKPEDVAKNFGEIEHSFN